MEHHFGNIKKAGISKGIDSAPANRSQAGSESKYIWKVDLMKSEKFWKGWFTGLTSSFLNVKIPKSLVLAER
jgi:protein phosphatase methylesterase 1